MSQKKTKKTAEKIRPEDIEEVVAEQVFTEEELPKTEKVPPKKEAEAAEDAADTLVAESVVIESEEKKGAKKAKAKVQKKPTKKSAKTEEVVAKEATEEVGEEEAVAEEAVAEEVVAVADEVVAVADEAVEEAEKAAEAVEEAVAVADEAVAEEVAATAGEAVAEAVVEEAEEVAAEAVAEETVAVAEEAAIEAEEAAVVAEEVEAAEEVAEEVEATEAPAVEPETATETESADTTKKTDATERTTATESAGATERTVQTKKADATERTTATERWAETESGEVYEQPCYSEEERALFPFTEARWIWADGKGKASDLCIFRRVFKISPKLKKPVLRIAANTHYFLNINGKFVVYEGGINHRANDGKNGYYDEVDVSKLVKRGQNSIVIIAHYNGCLKNGRAGLLLELFNGDESTLLASSSEFLVYRNESFKGDETERASVNYDGCSYVYDATVERHLAGIYQASYNSNIFIKSTEICAYGELPFGLLSRRQIPFFTFNQKLINAKKERRDLDENTYLYTMRLPRAMHIYPSISCKALAMEHIRIYTDRTKTVGDFGDKKEYSGYEIQYICKAQKQTFESFISLYGEVIYFEVPKTVKISKLAYRAREYNSAALSSFVSSETMLNGLFTKAVNTLKACALDTIVDNVERDRALTLESSNIAVRALLKSFDSNIHALVHKTVLDVLGLAREGRILTDVLSDRARELPSAGLLTFSGQGMMAAYCDSFNDLDELILERGVEYIKLWEMKNNLIVPRGGFMDNLYNIDAEVLENALYYSCLSFLKGLMERCGSTKYSGIVLERLDGFKKAFETRFFNGLAYSSRAGYSDDRANAFAVLSGLCDESKYETICDLLVSVQNASPYFEGFVLEALARMGKLCYVQRRMTSRYAGMVDSAESTLREDFCLSGAKTASRSVMPLSVLLEWFCGVRVSGGGNEIVVEPNLAGLSSLSYSVETARGSIRGEYKLSADGTKEYLIQNDTKLEVTVALGETKQTIGKGKHRFRA